MSLKIKIKGTEEIVKKLNDLGNQELKKARDKWLNTAVIMVQGEAKKEAPVDKGILRKYIDYKVYGNYAKVYDNVKYAYWVHEGTDPYTIRVNTAKVLSDGKSFFGKEVKHPGIRANPFFDRATENTRNKVRDKYYSILERLIKNEGLTN